MLAMFGKITLEFDQALREQLCQRYIPAYDPQRYGLVAVRLFCAREIVLTLYAEDKLTSAAGLSAGKFPVRKFKNEIGSAAELFSLVHAFNFTVTSGDYEMEDMEVVNR